MVNLISKSYLGGGVDRNGNDVDPNTFFLPDGTSRIFLTEGDFAITDRDVTDGVGGATMPAPDPEGTGVPVYTVTTTHMDAQDGSLSVDLCFLTPTGREVCSPADDGSPSLYVKIAFADGTEIFRPLFAPGPVAWYYKYQVSGRVHALVQYCR